MKDLEPYPFIQFEQGEEGSFFFAEEAVWPENSPKQINVTDRATILNFIIGLNGYTVCTGIDNGDLNNEKIVTVPLDSDETMTVGWISNERARACPPRPRPIWTGCARSSPSTATNPSDDAFPDRTGHGCHCY